MTIGRYRKSSARAKGLRHRRAEARHRKARRDLRIEALEARQLLATGPQLIGVQPNQGDLLQSGDVRNVAPQELIFHFDQGQEIDEATLGAIHITRSGGDSEFAASWARTDFNTKGKVVVEFRAQDPGPTGDEISIQFTKRSRTGSSVPVVTVEGKTILVELNSAPASPTKASELLKAINGDAKVSQLIVAELVSGVSATDIGTPAITYSPLNLQGANQASVSWPLGPTGVSLTAVANGTSGNGIRVSVTKSSHLVAGGTYVPGEPTITVNTTARTIAIDLDYVDLDNDGTPEYVTKAGQLVNAINAKAGSLVVASVASEANAAVVPIPAFSSLVLGGAIDAAGKATAMWPLSATVVFRAVQSGTSGNGIQILVTKSDRGAYGLPGVTVDLAARTVKIDLNSRTGHQTTAAQLVNAVRSQAGSLIEAANPVGDPNLAVPIPVSNPLLLTGSTDAATRAMTMWPLDSTEVTFRAVARGTSGNGVRILVSKTDRGGAGDPLITVNQTTRTISIALNSNRGNETTAAQLVTAVNANVQARALVVASAAVGDPSARVNIPAVNPLVLTGSGDVEIVPGYVGLGDTARDVVFRFAEPLPDDVYRIEIEASGAGALRNTLGMALNDKLDDGVDLGEDASMQFELDLAPQVLAVVPQPIQRSLTDLKPGTPAFEDLSQSTTLIEVYFNDDDLDPATAQERTFYQMTFTSDAGVTSAPFYPLQVVYDAASDRASLWFASGQLNPGTGTMHLRIGTDDPLPLASLEVPTAADPGSSFSTALDLSADLEGLNAIDVVGGGTTIADGQTFTIKDGRGQAVTFEFNEGGGELSDENHWPVPYKSSDNAVALATAIHSAISYAHLSGELSVSSTLNTDIARVVLSAGGSISLTTWNWFRLDYQSSALTVVGNGSSLEVAGDGTTVSDGQLLTISDIAGNTRTFEFNDPSVGNRSVSQGHLPIVFESGDLGQPPSTSRELAEGVLQAINDAFRPYDPADPDNPLEFVVTATVDRGSYDVRLIDGISETPATAASFSLYGQSTALQTGDYPHEIEVVRTGHAIAAGETWNAETGKWTPVMLRVNDTAAKTFVFNDPSRTYDNPADALVIAYESGDTGAESTKSELAAAISAAISAAYNAGQVSVSAAWDSNVFIVNLSEGGLVSLPDRTWAELYPRSPAINVHGDGYVIEVTGDGAVLAAGEEAAGQKWIPVSFTVTDITDLSVTFVFQDPSRSYVANAAYGAIVEYESGDNGTASTKEQLAAAIQGAISAAYRAGDLSVSATLDIDGLPIVTLTRGGSTSLGLVLAVDQDGSEIVDGTTFTIHDGAGVAKTFEYNDPSVGNGSVSDPSHRAVVYESGDKGAAASTKEQLAAAIHTAISAARDAGELSVWTSYSGSTVYLSGGTTDEALTGLQLGGESQGSFHDGAAIEVVSGGVPSLDGKCFQITDSANRSLMFEFDDPSLGAQGVRNPSHRPVVFESGDNGAIASTKSQLAAAMQRAVQNAVNAGQLDVVVSLNGALSRIYLSGEKEVRFYEPQSQLTEVAQLAQVRPGTFASGLAVEVADRGVSSLDGRVFQVTDVLGQSKRFEFNDPNVGGKTVLNPDHRPVVYASEDAQPLTRTLWDQANQRLAQAIQQAIQAAVSAGELYFTGNVELVSYRPSSSQPLVYQVRLWAATDLRFYEERLREVNTLSPLRLGSQSLLISSAIDPQVYRLDLPGASNDPGHRSIPAAIQSHLLKGADSENGITTLFYNFRADYGRSPNGTVLANLISSDQKERAREVFEIYGQSLGVQFIESATQGITIATGDLRVLDPTVATGRGGVTHLSGVSQYTGQPTIVLDNAENWYDLFGRSDDPLRPDSWFEAALVEVGRVLGLGDTYELPPGTTTGSDPTLAFDNTAEPIYPGSYDIVHGQYLYRPDGKDVDLYRIVVTRTGVLTAETIAERQADSSLLDSVISLYREQDGQRELVARNDDYFGEDSYLQFAIEPGVYYVGVSASGNTDYNLEVEDTGFGGVTEGKYNLRLTFQPDTNAAHSILDEDNKWTAAAGAGSQTTLFDGDGDGEPGGVYDFWFRVAPRQLFVDTYVRAGEDERLICPGTGSLDSPFCTISSALAAAQPGDIVRILGNGGTDGDLGTPEDNQPYRIGFDLLGGTLPDGSRLEIPKDVTVMVDAGAVIKMRRAYIEAGSHRPTEDRSRGVLQVLGTPVLLDSAGQVRRDAVGDPLKGTVYFTSLLDDSLGGDSVPSMPTTPGAGDWGGIIYRGDLDQKAGRKNYEEYGLFANHIGQADLRYGGGTVLIDGIPQVVAPVQISTLRPTLAFNTIQFSADAAISANPDSFLETDFLSPVPTAKVLFNYVRVGPELHGNRLTDNSFNGLFVRITTPAGGAQEKMTVTGRWDDTEVVHILTENLRIAGSPGGPIQEAGNLSAPAVSLVTVQTQDVGNVPAGRVDYRVTFVDADGQEGPASNPTASVLVAVSDPDAGATQSVLLSRLPTVPTTIVGGTRRLYRLAKAESAAGANQYVLIAELNATSTTYVDTGVTLGRLLQPSLLGLKARPHAQLRVDPGTVVKLSGAGIETGFGSQLLAEGDAGRRIVFTSLQDDRYGAGGTFQTRESGALAAGNWTGLYLSPTSHASIDHAVLAYGGGVAKVPGTLAGFNVVEIQQAGVRIAHSMFEFNADGQGGQAGASREGKSSNASAALFVRGAQPAVVDNVLRSNAGPAINIDVNSLNFTTVSDPGRSTGALGRASDVVYNQGPLIRGNRLGDNELNGMQVRGGTLTTQGVWDDTDIVHVLLDDTVYVPDFHTYGGLRLQSAANESLVVKMLGTHAGFTATSRPLDITDRIGGMLQIVGQPDHPVVLTSLYDDRVGAGYDPAGRPQTVTSNNPDLLERLEVIEVQADSGYTFTGPGVGLSTDGLGTAAAGTLQADIPLNAVIERAYLHVAVRNFTTAPPLTLPANITFAGQLVPLTWLPNVMDTDLRDFETGRADVTNIVRTAVGAGGAIFNFAVDETTTGIAGNIEGTSLSVIYSDPAVMDIRTAILLEGGVSGARPQAGTVKLAAPVDMTDPFFVAQLALGIQFSNNTLGTQFTYVEVDGQPLTSSAGNADDGALVVGQAITVGGVGDLPANPNFPPNPNHQDPDDELYDLSGVISPLSQSFDLQFGNPGGGDSIFLVALNISGTAQYLPYTVGSPADWNSVELEQYSHDRNVEVAVESETAQASVTGGNETPSEAQHLGQLAPAEYAGDDIRRLGFEIHGTLNRAADADVYSFEADAGTQVWLDIDRTTLSLDTVVELIDGQGWVIARSGDSGSEIEAGEPAYYNRAVFANPEELELMSANEVSPLLQSSQAGEDFWTVNTKDAGMRVVLPGPAGATRTYYVRVSGGAVLTDDYDKSGGSELPWCGDSATSSSTACYTTDLEFVRAGDGQADRVIDHGKQFLAAGLKAGHPLIVSGSSDANGDGRGDNDGTYTIASVTASQITLTSSGAIESQDAPAGARLQANATVGGYQLQIRLRETDEVPGSTIQGADIRYGTNGLVVSGLPTHSPLTGEAAEAVDAWGFEQDANDPLLLRDILGNLLTTDRGTLSVAGEIAKYEVQAIVFPTPPQWGNYRLLFDGQVTRNLAFNATAEQIQFALEALSNIGPGDVAVGGPVYADVDLVNGIVLNIFTDPDPPPPSAVTGTLVNMFTIKFQGALANRNVPQVSVVQGAPPMSPLSLPGWLTIWDGPGADWSAWHDVDWYQFDVSYESVPGAKAGQQQFVSTVFDLDYADGLARVNANLWVYDMNGNLVLVGRDSDVPEDRPLEADPDLDDLSRGSVGTQDPFIGPVALPTYQTDATTNQLVPGTYLVAVTSNAIVPADLQQFLQAATANLLTRLEPITSVARIAEDHVNQPGVYATAEAPQIPELVGAADQVTLFPPRAELLADGETFSITNAAGNTITYEFDFDLKQFYGDYPMQVAGNTVTWTNAGIAVTDEIEPGRFFTAGHVPILVDLLESAHDVGVAIAAAIEGNPPASPSLNDADPPDPTATQPVNFSTLSVAVGEQGQVVLREHVVRRTLLTVVTTVAAGTRVKTTTPITRDTDYDLTPDVVQEAAPGEADFRLFVSRPAIMPYQLGDVTMFVAEPGVRDTSGVPLADNRTDLVTVDPFTGQPETRVGAMNWNVGDLAMHPQGSPAGGGLFAYSIYEPSDPALARPATTDANSDDYLQIDPSSAAAANLAASIGTHDVTTSTTTSINNANVGLLFNALTFTNPESPGSAGAVRGFAVANRGDWAQPDPVDGALDSNRQNILFEFDPATGEVRDGGQNPDGNTGADAIDRGILNSVVDSYPANGVIDRIVGDAATTDVGGTAQFTIEEGDYFTVYPEDGRGALDYEFDSEWEYRLNVDAANNFYVRDEDFLRINGQEYEFDTGVVLVINAIRGDELLDTRYRDYNTYAFEIVVDPSGANIDYDFEFLSVGARPHPGLVSIRLADTDNRQQIVDGILTVLNEAGKQIPTPDGSDLLVAEQLDGSGRITLRWQNGSDVGIRINRYRIIDWPGGIPMPWPTTRYVEQGADGLDVSTRTRIRVEETDDAVTIAQAVADAVNGDPKQTAEAGAAANRLNFLNVDAAGVTFTLNTDPPPHNSVFGASVATPGVTSGRLDVNFLVDDNATEIAARIAAALDATGVPASRTGNVVRLLNRSASIECVAANGCELDTGAAAPGGSITGLAFVGPQLYAVTDEGGLFRIADASARALGTSFNPNLAIPRANVLDYVDGSREHLAQANTLTEPPTYSTFQARAKATFDSYSNTITITEPQEVTTPFASLGFSKGGNLELTGTEENDGIYTIAKIDPPQWNAQLQVNLITITLGVDDSVSDEESYEAVLTQTYAPFRFTGLVAGPQNTEDGRYANLLFAITDTGRLVVMDTFGNPQPVFANSVYYADTEITDPRGIAFSTLDDNLWHTTARRGTDAGHGILESYDLSRTASVGGTSLHFGYESATVQPQFGTGVYAPTATPQPTYAFPGGSQGSLVTNPFSLAGCSQADEPTLYFNYWLQTEQADARGETSLQPPADPMRDAIRVYAAGEDGRWLLLGTNNSDPGPAGNDDEFDPFPTVDPATGQSRPEQPVDRSELFDTANWRQARVDLSPLAGQNNVRLRFDFSTAGGMSSGGLDLQLDINTAGNQLRALPGADLRDAQTFTLGAWDEDEEAYQVPVTFEFDFGPTIVAPTGAAVRDGDTFSVDGRVFEFDYDGIVGWSGTVQNAAVRFTGRETASELAALIQQAVLDANPFPFAAPSLAIEVSDRPQDDALDQVWWNAGVATQVQLQGTSDQENDSLPDAVWSGLDGAQAQMTGEGTIGDNPTLGTPTNPIAKNLDVDLISLRLDPGDELIVEVAYAPPPAGTSRLDPYVRLFDFLGNELAFADDTGAAGSTQAVNARLDYSATSGGTYYVGISGAHNPSYDPRIGSLERAGVFLFDVEGVTQNDLDTLDRLIVPVVLKTEFANYGKPLSQSAQVVLVTEGRQWRIRQGTDTFLVEYDAGVLKVYQEKRDSSGPYTYNMTIVDPLVSRVGNRVNLPQAQTVLPDSSSLTVAGAGGVNAGSVRVAVHAGMSNLAVADAIRTALAEEFGGGDLESVKRREEFVQIVQYAVLDAGPLGLSGPSDEATALENSGLFGDRFGAFATSAGVNGQITAASPGALRMRDNAYEGIYLDDFLIGFASRGELVTHDPSATPNLTFVPNTDQPAGEIDQGVYQLEIRQASDYGTRQVNDITGVVTLAQSRTLDVNERLSNGTTVVVPSGASIAEGATLSVGDGSRTVVFEFDDLTIADGVQDGHLAIAFDPGDSDVVMARRLRDAINAARAAEGLQLRATTPDGVFYGPSSSSNHVELYGDATVSGALVGQGPVGNPPADESNDTLANAVVTGIGETAESLKTILGVSATLVVGEDTEAILEDGDYVDLEVADAAGNRTPLRFVFDSGYEFHLSVNVADPSNPQVIRDGDLFRINAESYRFDAATAILINATAGSELFPATGGDDAYTLTLQITDPTLGVRTYPFEFVLPDADPHVGYDPIYITPELGTAGIAGAVKTAINNKQIKVGTDTLVAYDMTGTGRIGLRWQNSSAYPISAAKGSVGTPPATTAYVLQKTYEFDTGAVVVINAGSGADLLPANPGDAYTLKIIRETSTGQKYEYNFQFVDEGENPDPRFRPIEITADMDRAGIARAVATAVNATDVSELGELTADALDGTGRVTLYFQPSDPSQRYFVNAEKGKLGDPDTTNAYEIEGVSRTAAGATPVYVEETFTAPQLAQAVVAAVSGSAGVEASSMGSRLNFLSASAVDFRQVSHLVFLPAGTPAPATAERVIPFLVGDDGEAIALRLQQALTDWLIASTVTGSAVTLRGADDVFYCSAAEVGGSANCPLLTASTSRGEARYQAAGVIGDNNRVSPLSADVDLYRVVLAEGATITVDVDAGELGSPLDSVLRVFHSTGAPVLQLDQSGQPMLDPFGRFIEVMNDDGASPEEAARTISGQDSSRDSYLVFTAPATGTYFIGVSGFGNDAYRVTKDAEGSGRASSASGAYEIIIQQWGGVDSLEVIQHAGRGAENLFRDQGQLVIRGNTIRDAWNYGISVQGGTRETTGATHPGSPRNLSHVNTSRLAPGITITNNTLASNRSGGILFAGDEGSPFLFQQPAVVPYGRIVNNTIVGMTAYKQRLSQVDVVFLIDTSGSMEEDIAEIRARLGEFDTEMSKARIDANYGLVTFPGDHANADPQMVQDIVDFTTFINGPFSTFGLGGGTEKGSRAVREGLNDFDDTTTFHFRAGSTIVPILITDEGDDSADELDEAISIASFLEAVFFGITLDPSVVIETVDAPPAPNHYSQIAAATGGQIFNIGSFRLDPTGFFEAFTAAVTGGVVRPAAAGIVVRDNASPTILNNVVGGQNWGIAVAPDSQSSVLAGNVYWDNGTDTAGVAKEDFALHLPASTQIFTKPYAGNFYPSNRSPLIDSSVESLEDRLDLVQIKQQLGISLSPVLVRDEDQLGQLRVDDPAVAPPAGIGENVFKDRGAIDRADFQGPTASVLYPLDNGRDDADRRVGAVSVDASLDRILIQVTDRFGGVIGTGVDDASVTSYAVKVYDGTTLLTEGVDFAVDYHATNNVISLTPLKGLWQRDHNYTIELANATRITISGKSGADLQDGDDFHLRDALGARTTFEFDTGYVIEVPQTLAIRVPPQGGGPGGVADGDLITVSDATHSVTLELDNNGVFDPLNVQVSFDSTKDQGSLADALVKALQRISDIVLYPANAGSGLVHLGVDGTQTLTVASNTLTSVGVPVGVAAYQEFVVDDFSKHITFYFASGTPATFLNRVKIPFEYSQTHEQIAAAIAQAINAAGLGLYASDLGDGRVHVGGGLNHHVDVSASALILTGEPGVQMPFGIRIPTEAGKFYNLINDGDYFTLTDPAGVSVTFEFDSNNYVTPGATRIPFKITDSTNQLANTLAITIRNAGFGLYPYNAGYGIVVLGGEGYLLNLDYCTLTQVGASGVPAAIPIPFSPNDTAETMAATIAQVVNQQQLPGVTAVAEGDEVVFYGATDVAGQVASLFYPIRDLAGNSLHGNQEEGTSVLTVSLGSAMDFGDAPSSYPTLREQDGARHVVKSGFSLGGRVDVDGAGLSSAAADGDDTDGGDDEDGVLFDPVMPLVPGATFKIDRDFDEAPGESAVFKIVVSTGGIVSGVVPRGVLNAWIDFNRNGQWEESERILSNVILDKTNLDADGKLLEPLTRTVPTWAVPGETFVRFRLSEASLTSPTGAADSGEVEDYRIWITNNPWQNISNHFDVNGDGGTSPIDALWLINYLNGSPVNPLPLPRPDAPPYYDVNGDGSATPADVLAVVNELNRLNAPAGGEGEASNPPLSASAARSNHLEDVLRGEEEWLAIVSDVNRSLTSPSAVDSIFADLGG